MLKLRHSIIFFCIAASVILGVKYIVAGYMPKQTKPAPLKEFSLTDTNGKVFNTQSLRGHWTLLFFGYMTCPDVCPRTLGIVRDIWGYFPSNSPAPVKFVFANINSREKDLFALKGFLNNYHPDFIGINGSKAEMAQLSDQLGIFQQNNGNKIEHTASLILIDPKGRLNSVFSPPLNAEEIAKQLEVLAIMKR